MHLIVDCAVRPRFCEGKINIKKMKQKIKLVKEIEDKFILEKVTKKLEIESKQDQNSKLILKRWICPKTFPPVRSGPKSSDRQFTKY